MAHYTFDIIKYTLITEEGETYKDFIEMMPSLTVQATNYIAATLKAEKAYPSDKYSCIDRPFFCVSINELVYIFI